MIPPRIAWFSPLVADGTGRSAAFSAEVLPLLGESVHPYVDSPEGESYLRAFLHEPPFDAFVYHLEDRPENMFVHRMAMVYPGIVIAHDVELPLLERQCALEESERRLIRARQVTAPLEARSEGWLSLAAAVVVQNEHAVSLVRQRNFDGPVALTGSPVSVPAELELWRARARAAWEMGTGETAIAFCGTNRFEGRAECQLRIFNRFAERVPAARLIWLIGRGESDPEQLLHGVPRDRIRVVRYDTYSELKKAIAGADLLLGLHFSLTRSLPLAIPIALRFGVPTLVSDFGPASEIPEAVAPRVPLGAGEEEIALRVLLLLHENIELRKTLSHRAREYGELTFAPENIAFDLRWTLDQFQSPIAGAMQHRESAILQERERVLRALPPELSGNHLWH